jgi:hypothetical protein
VVDLAEFQGIVRHASIIPPTHDHLRYRAWTVGSDPFVTARPVGAAIAPTAGLQ